MRNLFLPLTLLFSLFATDLRAWGEKGHNLASEAATWTTPDGMPAFFHRAYPLLVYLANDPDRVKGAGEALDAFNSPNHFLDYEYVAALELPRDRYEYIDLLYRSGTLRQFGIEVATPGFLPWRIAELTDELTAQWRFWRKTNDPVAREQIEDNIILLSGTLAHFTSDAGNPHHATIHYNGWAGENREGFAYDCETHSRFESQFVSRAIDLVDVVSAMRPLEPRENAFAAAMQMIAESQGKVRDLYVLDRESGFLGKGNEESRGFAVARIAAGASLTRDLWWSAWIASEKEPERRRR